MTYILDGRQIPLRDALPHHVLLAPLKQEQHELALGLLGQEPGADGALDLSAAREAVLDQLREVFDQDHLLEEELHHVGRSPLPDLVQQLPGEGGAREENARLPLDVQCPQGCLKMCLIIDYVCYVLFVVCCWFVCLCVIVLFVYLLTGLPSGSPRRGRTGPPDPSRRAGAQGSTSGR